MPCSVLGQQAAAIIALLLLWLRALADVGRDNKTISGKMIGNGTAVVIGGKGRYAGAKGEGLTR
jgi:hypothetical protein